MAYMKVTSLDGAPSWSDYLRIASIRIANKRYRDGADLPPRIVTWCIDVLKWVLTIGLSGWFFNLIALTSADKPVILDSASLNSLQSLVDAERATRDELARFRTTLSAMHAMIEQKSAKAESNQPFEQNNGGRSHK